jgi:hypothetical protein
VSQTAVDAPREVDPRGQADGFRERALDTSSRAHRVKLSLAAHRLRVSFFEDTGAIGDLCAAKRDLEVSLAEVEEVQASLRQIVLDTHREFVQAYKAQLKLCPTSTPTGRTIVVPLLDPLGAGPRRSGIKTSADDTISTAPPRMRGATIAGATFVGVGVGLLGAGGYGLARMLIARRAGEALINDVGDGPADAGELARDARLREEHLAGSRLALGAGITGGVAVVIGAAVLGVHRRHTPRDRRSVAVLPTTRGFVLSARF